MSRPCTPWEGPRITPCCFGRNYRKFFHEKTSDEAKLRDMPQNNWLVLTKSVKGMKDKERMKTITDQKRLGGFTAKCNVESWIKLWKRKRTLGGNLVKF